MGIFFGIYGFLVVFAGAALVLVLIGAIPMSYYNKTLVVEIFSQILTGKSLSLSHSPDVPLYLIANFTD